MKYSWKGSQIEFLKWAYLSFYTAWIRNLTSGGSTLAHSKGVADKPSPRAVRLAASDLDRIHGHRLGRGYLPFGVHQCDVAGLDDLLDVEVEGRLHSRKRSQLLSQRLSFFSSPCPFKKDRSGIINAKH